MFREAHDDVKRCTYSPRFIWNDRQLVQQPDQLNKHDRIYLQFSMSTPPQTLLSVVESLNAIEVSTLFSGGSWALLTTLDHQCFVLLLDAAVGSFQAAAAKAGASGGSNSSSRTDIVTTLWTLLLQSNAKASIGTHASCVCTWCVPLLLFVMRERVASASRVLTTHP